MDTSCRLQSRCCDFQLGCVLDTSGVQGFRFRCRCSAARRIVEGFVENASAISAMVRRVGLFVPRSNWPM